MTDAELSLLEVRRDRVVEGIKWLRERIRVVTACHEVEYGREIADLTGRLELLRLELQELRETVEKEVRDGRGRRSGDPDSGLVTR